MSDIDAALEQLNDLCASIHRFSDQIVPQILYRAPVIDWHHPDDYAQTQVSGLRKFLSAAEAERDHVAGLVSSPVRPKDFTTNAPHLLAVWHEFERASRPLGSIAQSLEYGQRIPVKVDIVARGGDEWIKVNTIKESRLLAEFREQDSYLNSDYDSDTSCDSSSSSAGSGPSRPRPRRLHRPSSSRPALSNTLITQGKTLLQAAIAYPLRPGGRQPRIRMILNRLIRPPEGFADDRIDRTIEHLTGLGIAVQLGETAGSPTATLPRPSVRPTRNIVLDLSVLVALCCDSSHYPLPNEADGFESRFRALSISHPDAEARVGAQLVLGKHSNTSKDLRDQLQWEAQHPLIQELEDRLAEVSVDGADLQFWITEEVKERLPGLVDVIGGPMERKRGKALQQGGNPEAFWIESRWAGKEGVLRRISIRVLPSDRTDIVTSPASDVESGGPRSPFQDSLLATCQSMLALMDAKWPAPDDTGGDAAPPSTPSTAIAGASAAAPSILPATSAKQRHSRRSRNPKRPTTVFPANRYPSAHTLRSLVAGAERGWTILTNNRGAIGKIGREMRISEGLPMSTSPGGVSGGAGSADGEIAALWVVNPSSLSEWRRLEVERANARVRAKWAAMHR